MKKRYMIPALLACSGFCMAGTASVATTAAAPAAEEAEGKGSILDDIDLFGDEYGDESTPIPNDLLTRALTDLHKGAYEKAGFQFLVEQAFLYTKGHHAAANEETAGSSRAGTNSTPRPGCSCSNPAATRAPGSRASFPAPWP